MLIFGKQILQVMCFDTEGMLLTLTFACLLNFNLTVTKKNAFKNIERFCFFPLDKCEPVHSDGTLSPHLERMDGRKK